MTKTIWANSLICNEERFIWHALMSVKDYVDKILVWDTGSADKTVEIVKNITDPKIEFAQKGKVDEKGFAKLRQQMLEQTSSDWILIVDGDEVWTRQGMEETRRAVDQSGDAYDLMVHPTVMLVGDIRHALSVPGYYQIAGLQGHLNIRCLNRRVPGLHVVGEYGFEGFADEHNLLIQNRDQNRFYFANNSYFHASFLTRSAQDRHTLKRSGRFKYELGYKLKDSQLPEVFFATPPAVVDPLPSKRSIWYLARAAMETPLKRLKRLLFPHTKVGY